MFSAAQVDKKKVGKLAVAIQDAFQELGALPGSKPPLPASSQNSPPVRPADADQATPVSGDDLTSPEENEDLENLHNGLQKILAPEISRQEVALRRTPDGLVISFEEKCWFFESGSAKVRAKSSSPPWAGLRFPSWRNGLIACAVQRVTLTTFRFTTPSSLPIVNSTTRATEAGATSDCPIQIRRPTAWSVTGYAQYHPIADNSAAGGRAQNRQSRYRYL